MSRARIDRLGDRMREGDLTSDDVRFLDEYRRSFGGAHEFVVTTIRENLQLEPTGRPAKSTVSLIEKLRRESIRLSQVQDIAGCRIVVTGASEQDRVVASLCALFPGASVVDRRVSPSSGYRAVHVIPRIDGKPIEIQVRTTLQHLWAEFSEKLSDVEDPAIKYGGGNVEIQQMLMKASQAAAMIEGLEEAIASLDMERFSAVRLEMSDRVTARKAEVATILRDAIAFFERIKGEHDLSD